MSTCEIATSPDFAFRLWGRTQPRTPHHAGALPRAKPTSASPSGPSAKSPATGARGTCGQRPVAPAGDLGAERARCGGPAIPTRHRRGLARRRSATAHVRRGASDAASRLSGDPVARRQRRPRLGRERHRDAQTDAPVPEARHDGRRQTPTVSTVRFRPTSRGSQFSTRWPSSRAP